MNASSVIAQLPVLGSVPRPAARIPGQPVGSAAGFLGGLVAGLVTGSAALSSAESAAVLELERAVRPGSNPSARPAEAWPVPSALERLLPGGLPRGGTMAVEGSLSLLLASMGAASAAGAWCALVGLPPVSAEAAREFGIAVEHTPVVAAPRPGSSRAWTELIAALLDTLDVVAARPGAVLDAGDLSRLAARARTKGTTLLLSAEGAAAWPGLDLRLRVQDQTWQRAPGPRGRLTARRITVAAHGRGRFARPREARLWLPDRWGRIAPAESVEVSLVKSAGVGSSLAATAGYFRPVRGVGAR